MIHTQSHYPDTGLTSPSFFGMSWPGIEPMTSRFPGADTLPAELLGPVCMKMNILQKESYIFELEKIHRTNWKMLLIHVTYCKIYIHIKYKTYLHNKTRK